METGNILDDDEKKRLKQLRYIIYINKDLIPSYHIYQNFLATGHAPFVEEFMAFFSIGREVTHVILIMNIVYSPRIC